MFDLKRESKRGKKEGKEVNQIKSNQIKSRSHPEKEGEGVDPTQQGRGLSRQRIAGLLLLLTRASLSSHNFVTALVPMLMIGQIQQAKDLFRKSFGDSSAASDSPLYCASAPGRVNFIGEHTDYTGGFVLPLAIACQTVCYGTGAVVSKSASGARRSRIVSTNTKGVVEFEVSDDLAPSTLNPWANYVKGVALQYLPCLGPDETFVVEVAFSSNVPIGSGLSSSASLETATAIFLEQVMKFSESKMNSKEQKITRAKLCQRAENTFCGVPCGIMDQFISGAACDGKLLLIDCRSLDYKEVPLGSSDDEDKPVLVVANSNVKHSLGDSEYPVRVQQCKDATAVLVKVNGCIKSLRDATIVDIEAAKTVGLEGTILKRALHVVSENKRTVDAAAALESGDWKAAGKLMNQSHSSMKDDYQVSCDEIDVLVSLSQAFEGVYGSRLTGGGFGGCTVTLVRKEVANGLIGYLKEEYKKRTGKECDCFVTSPSQGAMAVDLDLTR